MNAPLVQRIGQESSKLLMWVRFPRGVLKKTIFSKSNEFGTVLVR